MFLGVVPPGHPDGRLSLVKDPIGSQACRFEARILTTSPQRHIGYKASVSGLAYVETKLVKCLFKYILVMTFNLYLLWTPDKSVHWLIDIRDRTKYPFPQPHLLTELKT